MDLRLATFNLENLFTRPSAMSQDTDAAGREAIEDHATANAIIAKDEYTAPDRAELVVLSKKYGWHEQNAPKNALVFLQKLRGQLFRQPTGKPLEVVANGRADWTGWFELRRENVSWNATYNTARVIAEVNPEILICIEVENRPTLKRFNEQVLDAEFGKAFPHVMVIDGNDDRGIDVGILSKHPIVAMRSHVTAARDGFDPVFSRDCPEYDVILPGNRRLVVIPNHFKSKRNGNDQQSQDRRTAQAAQAHSIAKSALQRSDLVVVGGDLNDVPDSLAIQPLLADSFKDVSEHADWPSERPGTYGTGLTSQKIDYLLLSSALFQALQTVGVERRGSYHPRLWTPFDTVESGVDEASDHHCVWADVAL